jgi:hypothetical protein
MFSVEGNSTHYNLLFLGTDMAEIFVSSKLDNL